MHLNKIKKNKKAQSYVLQSIISKTVSVYFGSANTTPGQMVLHTAEGKANHVPIILFCNPILKVHLFSVVV